MEFGIELALVEPASPAADAQTSDNQRAHAHYNLAEALVSRGDRSRAHDEYAAALAIAEPELAAHPDDKTWIDWVNELRPKAR